MTGEPVQPQGDRLQVAVGNQVQPHGGRNEKRGGDRRLVGGDAQHQHGFRADGRAAGVAQRLGGQLETVRFQGRQDGILPGPFARLGRRLGIRRAGDHDLIIAGALGPHQAEIEP